MFESRQLKIRYQLPVFKWLYLGDLFVKHNKEW